MKYRVNHLFPVRFWTFQAPKELTMETLEKLKQLEYRSYNEPYGVGTSDQLHSLPEFRDIHEWFQKCVDQVHKDNGWHCDRLVVNKSWANRSDAKSGHHHSPHRHPMSYLSGIFYLTEGSPTVFLDPVRTVSGVSFTSMVDRPQRIDSLSILVQVDLSSSPVTWCMEVLRMKAT